MMLLLTVIIVFVFVVVKLYQRCSYWKKKGIDYADLRYTFGCFNENIFRGNKYALVLQKIYEKYPDKRYVGFFNYFHPVLLIRDPELVKRITVKDYENFNLHSEVIPSYIDPLWTHNMVGVRERERWVNIRGSLTTFFTSNKLKASFPFLQKHSENFCSHLKSRSNGAKMVIEIEEQLRRLTSDISGYIAFGVSCNSLKHPDNEFFKMASVAMQLSPFRGIRHVCFNTAPKLLKWLGFKVYNKKSVDFFIDIMKRATKLRIDGQCNGPDLINTLLEMNKKMSNIRYEESEKTAFNGCNNNGTIDYEVLTAQALLLFFAGFETVTSTVSLLAYELTMNPDVQQKLYNEIIKTTEKFDGEVTYDAIMSMKYLDNVLNEALRLHPPTAIIDRMATSDYIIEPELPGEKKLYIEKGTLIWILQQSIQIDSKYFHNPHKFDPDRFNEDNKHNIEPYTFIPFGTGPKSCIGLRYGMFEVKLIIVNLLLNYELLPTEKTKVANSSNTYNVRDYGVWVELNPR